MNKQLGILPLVLMVVACPGLCQQLTLPMADLGGSGAPAMNCTVGQRYFRTDAVAGQNIYLCTANPNVWTQVSGGGATVVQAAGSPAYKGTFVGAGNLTVTNAQHGFNSANIQVACYDNSAPAALFEPASVTIDSATYQVVITFAGTPTGYCVLQGGGAVACGTYTVASTNAAFIVADTVADVALFTLPQYGKIIGGTIKHSVQFSDGGGAMTDVSVSAGNGVAPFNQFMTASSIGEATAVSDTTFYDTTSFKSLTMAVAGGAVSAHFIATGRDFGDGAATFLTGGSVTIWACSLRLQ